MIPAQGLKTEAREPLLWFHWQNLNDKKDGTQGSGLRHGRCWWHFRNRRTVEVCWLFGSWHCGLEASIGDENLTFSLMTPLLSIWLSFSTLWWLIGSLAPRKALTHYPDTIMIDERECGISVFGGRVWIKPWCKRHEWVSADPWWVRGVSFSINPFGSTFQRHEVLCSDGWKLMPQSTIGSQEESPLPLYSSFPYRYILKSGKVQIVTATVHIERRAWRPRCFQWTRLLENVRTSIDVKFSDEIGERTGTWKGGCVGCGWDLLPDETAEAALRRMEAVRKF